jgi:hypothetical protein
MGTRYCKARLQLGRYQIAMDSYLILYSRFTGRYQTDPDRCQILYTKARLLAGTRQIQLGPRYCRWVSDRYRELPDIVQYGNR